MLRWRLEIEEYGPKLINVKGKDNVVADALSRLPARSEDETVAADDNIPLFAVTPTAIKEAQDEAGMQPTEGTIKQEVHGVVLLTLAGSSRMVIPRKLQDAVMRT